MLYVVVGVCVVLIITVIVIVGFVMLTFFCTDILLKTMASLRGFHTCF